MTSRTVLRLAALPAVLIAIALGLLSLPQVRGRLRSSPLMTRLNSPSFRRFDSAIYNVTHRPVSPSEMGDGGRADRMRLSDPMGLARGPDGTLYVSDRGFLGPGHVVWALSGGAARVVAGTGRRGVPKTGIPARAADLGSPQSLAVDRVGRLYIADSYNHVVLRLESDGRLERVAGTGQQGFSGDGGSAAQAELNQPYDVSVGPAGDVFIADYGNHRIRRVTPDGVIHTVAGTGKAGYAGDGGPATAALLNGPYGVCFAPRYGLLIGDSGNNVVRVVDSSGTIRTLVGTGEPGTPRDSVSAKAARLDSPQGLAVDSRGNLFVGDEHNHAILIVDSSGMVRRMAGGRIGFAPDGSRASDARLNDPENFLPLPDETLLFTEAGNHRVRRITPSGQLATLAGSGE